MKSKFLTSLMIIFFAVNSYSQEMGNFTDPRDGRKYRTVKIGTQTWLAEDLAFGRAESGLRMVIDSNHRKFYKYTWDEAQNAVPSGWHLPSVDELKVFITNLGKKRRTVFLNLENNEFNFNAEYEVYTGTMVDMNRVGKSYNIMKEYRVSRFSFWSSTPKPNNSKIYIFSDDGLGSASRTGIYRVRCIKD